MTKLPIGIQLYSVRDEMEKDFEGTIKTLAEYGYTAVEFAGLFDHTAEDVKRICKEAGVDPISAHVGPDVLLANLEEEIKKYHDIGCRYIGIPWASVSRDLPGGTDYPAFLEAIRKIAAEMSKYGMKLVYHNHDFEFTKIDGQYKIDILYADTTPDELQTELDTCWVRVGGPDPAEFVLKYSGRAPLVHIKDYVGGPTANMYKLIDGGVVESKVETDNGFFEQRPVGYGVQDVQSIISASEKAGAECIIVEQDDTTPGMTSMECAKKSIEFIKSL